MIWLYTAAGAAMMAFTLLDVFLTVLYARIGSGVMSRRLACWLWGGFRAASAGMTVKRDAFLSYCGPVFLVALVVTWMIGLTCGAALIIRPRLGAAVRGTGGPTPTDFVTAVYVAGDSLTTVGASDFSPQTAGTRLFYTFDSFVGISVLTLTLTYLLEIYTALQRRNTFALKLHLLTAETGDAAELVALVGPDGRFDVGYAHLVEIAAETAALKESHHFYPALFYCRFRQVQYALSRVALVTLDTVTLVKSGLDDEAYGWLKRSAVMEQLWRSSMQLLAVLAVGFLPNGLDPSSDDPAGGATQRRWRRRYRAAVGKFKDAGIATMADLDEGEAIYVNLRIKWDRYVCDFAAHLAHDIDNVDIALRGPADAPPAPAPHDRTRAAG